MMSGRKKGTPGAHCEWESHFGAFFGQVERGLAAVLGANGCREGWLQGEAFRRLRRKGIAIYTNHLSLPGPNGRRNRKADLAIYESHAADAPLDLIGELKVLGEKGYYQKNLTGGDVSEIRRRLARTGPGGRLTIFNRQRDRKLVVGPGLLADYFRLVDFAADRSVARVLILCVEKASQADRLGEILRRIDFEHRADPIHDCARFWAKCWRVGGARGEALVASRVTPGALGSSSDSWPAGCLSR